MKNLLLPLLFLGALPAAAHAQLQHVPDPISLSTMPKSAACVGTNASGVPQVGTCGGGGGSAASTFREPVYGGTFGQYQVGRFYGISDGNVTSNGYAFTADQAVASLWVPQGSGTLKSISFFISTAATSASWNVECGIYSNANGAPGTLLASSAAVNLGTGTTAVTCNLSTGYAVTAGTPYFLALVADTTSGAKIETYGDCCTETAYPYLWFNFGTTSAEAIFANAQNTGQTTTVTAFGMPANGATWSLNSGAPELAVGF